MTKVHSYLKRRTAAQPAGAPGPWAVAALCAAYNWPTTAPGGGKIGILEMGGGFTQLDLDAFSNANGLPLINVTWNDVDGQTPNAPGLSDADFEVALDIQVAFASYFYATGGKTPTITIYAAQSIPEALIAAADDGCSVFSMSWGDAESAWGKAAVKQMNAAAVFALSQNCIPFAAAGDNNADDGTNLPAVDCPASCPAVVGCGGTSKVKGGSEVVWDNNPKPNGEGTGGGFSKVFPVQKWQLHAPKPPHPSLGRMVPDVAADADPNTGYEIFVQGAAQVVGGTSAVAPLYAGLFAAFGPGIGPVLAKLWQTPHAFTDITQGGNGLYKALKGPDPCTGLGAPIGAKIAALF